MNLYNYHTVPNSLIGFDQRDDIVPDLISEYLIGGGHLTKKQLKYIASDTQLAYTYAVERVRGRWPRGEAAILLDPYYSLKYAERIIQGRWPEAEVIISKDSMMSLHYAQYVIAGRFPEGEAAIASNAYTAINYSHYVIKNKWPPGEAAMRKDPEISRQYLFWDVP